MKNSFSENFFLLWGWGTSTDFGFKAFLFYLEGEMSSVSIVITDCVDSNTCRAFGGEM
jgi:hypothetical protein